MNIDILAVGDIKEKYFSDAINEYLKRLKVYASINIIELAEERISNNPSEAEIAQGMEKEGQRILEKINPRSYVIALCVEGKLLSSEDLSRKMEEITVDGFSDITFIIGGSNGLSPQVKQKAQLKLSFSKMTFPHQLMRVVLLEQVYRGFKIMRGEKYHK